MTEIKLLKENNKRMQEDIDMFLKICKKYNIDINLEYRKINDDFCKKILKNGPQIQNLYLYYFSKDFVGVKDEMQLVEIRMRQCFLFSFMAIKVFIIHWYNKITNRYVLEGIM